MSVVDRFWEIDPLPVEWARYSTEWTRAASATVLKERAMAMVRFASTCDICEARSREYEAWPICRDCQQHVCPACDVPSARSEDEDHRTVCLSCFDVDNVIAPALVEA